jgi:hypothetical protein
MKKIHTLTAIAAFGVSALSAQASIVLPDAGNSVTFEAEAHDAESGTSFVADATNASGGSFVDGLAASAAGGGNGDFISFDISNLDTALIYEITFNYRNKSNNGDKSTEWEFYGVTGGSTYTLLTSIVAPRTGAWNGPFFEAPTSTGFNIAAGTTAIQVENLTAGNFSHLDSFTISAIPEHGTYALLAGLTGLVFVMVRRRR